MDSNIQKITQFQQDFSNFEIFSHVLRGYNIDLQQIDRGAFSGDIQQIQCGNVFINRLATTRRLEVMGSAPLGLITFGVPTDLCLPFTWRNKFSTANTLQIHRSEMELEMLTQPFFEAIDVSISEESFNHLLQHWELPALDKLINKREMFICHPVTMKRLRAMLRLVSTTLVRNPNGLISNPELQSVIQYEIPYLLAQNLISSTEPAVKVTVKKRHYILKEAIEYIKTKPKKEVTLSQFCYTNGINERTLQRIFLAQYGVSPKAYAQAYHLNKAYKVLIKSNPDTIRVSTIANNLGYSHLSQFSKDYKQHFSELPSVTLMGK